MKDSSVKERILKALRDSHTEKPGQPVSGGELAKRLGVSRAAVWKQVEDLRRSGYPIGASPRIGYWLEPDEDLIIPEAVAAAAERVDAATDGRRRVDWRIKYHLSLASTNDLAMQMAREGSPEGTVVIAEEQTRGRGRLGRSWYSPKGTGIWMSIILRPTCAPAATTAVTLVAAVAAARAIEIETGLKPGIKWPNDLLLSGRKACGILTEISAELDRVNYLILGLGVNVNHRVDDFAPEISGLATSLRIEVGRRVSRSALAGRILSEFGPRYHDFLERGFDSTRREWMERSATLRRAVVVTGPASRLEGLAIDLDPDGALVIKTSDGDRHRVTGGEVTLRT